MKRILSLFLAILLLCFVMVSCDRDNSNEPEQTSATTTQHVHIFSKSTCKSPKVCECGATEGKPSNKHNFKDGACVDCTKKLVVEIARLVTKPGTLEPLSGFYISRGEGDKVEYVTVRADIVDKELIQQGIYTRVAIKISQEAITTGVYEWVIERNTYIPAIDNYDRSYLYGTLNADDFLDADLLTVTQNEGFAEDEFSRYMKYVPTAVDRMVNQNLIPAFENNPSKISVADIGFVNYEMD